MKTAELEGAVLNYWVGQADGKESYLYNGYCFLRPPSRPYGNTMGNYDPSTNWTQGGPIIEREEIELYVYEHRNHSEQGKTCWAADWYPPSGEIQSGWHEQYGATPLIAAMRCFVASKYGEEVGNIDA